MQLFWDSKICTCLDLCAYGNLPFDHQTIRFEFDHVFDRSQLDTMLEPEQRFISLPLDEDSEKLAVTRACAWDKFSDKATQRWTHKFCFNWTILNKHCQRLEAKHWKTIFSGNILTQVFMESMWLQIDVNLAEDLFPRYFNLLGIGRR